MRLALLTAVAASLLLGAFSASCGLQEQPCCSDGFCSDVDADCVDGTCVVAVPGQGACTGMGTKRGEACCSGSCVEEELSCSEGTCVDVNDDLVIVQNGPQPGKAGGACIGADEICDEGDDFILECVKGICEEPETVQIQSVCPSPGVVLLYLSSVLLSQWFICRRVRHAAI